jgi:D-sedoheptulose 7-phosphate isomerase
MLVHPGVGGSAGNASHAVNDFRKITRVEAYAPTVNVSLTPA